MKKQLGVDFEQQSPLANMCRQWLKSIRLLATNSDTTTDTGQFAGGVRVSRSVMIPVLRELPKY